MVITLRAHEIRAIRKMMDEVFSKRLYAYRGFKTLYFEKDIPDIYPNMNSTAYIYIVDFEDILSGLGGGQ